MNILITFFLFIGIYIMLGAVLLSPFMLSARISRWEEGKHRIKR